MNFDKDVANLNNKMKENERFGKAVSRIKEVSDSYISKEKFIEMINTLDFKFIKSGSFHFITGFKYDENEDTVKNIGFDISID